jgi:dTDP-glucose 4,6-dehydratase
MSRLLCTGGAGFIGSHLVDLLLTEGDDVIVLDALSFGSDIRNLPADIKIVGGISGQMVTEIPKGRCVLVVGDVSDARLVQRLVDMVNGVYHLAAQTHVDRSYGDVLPFVNSNVVGAYAVLEAVRSAKHRVRCVFMSTDEVYGDIETGLSKETDPLAPRNIYSALKAGGDLLAQTYAAIFNLDVVIVRPANNYGPRQFEEKLIPKILTALQAGNKIPVYGDGSQIRDWLYVKDTARALIVLYEKGGPGGIYNLGAHQFLTVLEVIQAIGEITGIPWRDHVEYVSDRIRGDRRYALDRTKTKAETGWEAYTAFENGLDKTVKWYRDMYVDGKRR